MTIGGKPFSMRRRWLALLSLIWVAAIYAAWVLLNSSSRGLDHARAQCQLFDRSYPYAYAECMQFASQAIVQHHADVATMAALIAIAPVALLWGSWLAARFLRACRSVECAKPAA